MKPKRTPLLVALAVGLLLAGPVAGSVQAGSGRSYSSGSSSRSSSSGRSFSSGSSFSSPSRGSSSSSSHSFSPPPSSRPSSPSGSFSGSKPSAPSGKSYSSGFGSSSSAGSKPSHTLGGGSYDAGAAAAERRQESRSAYSSGKSYSSGTSAPTASPPNIAAGRAPSGKSYSSGRPSPDGMLGGPTGGHKPGGSYDAPAATAQRHEESRAAYGQGQQPRTSYTDPRGNVRPIDPRDQRIEQLRRELDEERWANREVRQQQWYGSSAPRPVVVYRDPYSSFFWWWLLDQSAQQQALWAYHHRDMMDAARYQELLSKNAQLETQIRALEAKGVSRNPSYAPSDLDPDLMYTDEYVTAAYNPQPTPAAAPVREVSGESRVAGRSRAASGWRVFANVLLIAGALVFLIWLGFFKRWGGSND